MSMSSEKDLRFVLSGGYRPIAMVQSAAVFLLLIIGLLGCDRSDESGPAQQHGKSSSAPIAQATPPTPEWTDLTQVAKLSDDMDRLVSESDGTYKSCLALTRRMAAIFSTTLFTILDDDYKTIYHAGDELVTKPKAEEFKEKCVAVINKTFKPHSEHVSALGFQLIDFVGRSRRLSTQVSKLAQETQPSKAAFEDLVRQRLALQSELQNLKQSMSLATTRVDSLLVEVITTEKRFLSEALRSAAGQR